VYVGSYYCTRW